MNGRWVCFGFLLGLAAAAGAKPVPWQGPPFFVASPRMPLSTVLVNLGANYGLSVVVSPAINDTFAGRLEERQPGEALRTLTRLYQLLPYYDGLVLYLYKAQEFDRALLTPASLPAPSLAAMIRESGLIDPPACQAQAVSAANALQISGVPVCLSRLNALARQLDEQHRVEAQSRETVRLYPLRYANAADTSYSYRNQTVVVPGLVSVLREMVRSRAPAGPGAPAATAENGLPVFAADTRQNAVLIRDLAKNQSLYPDLIARLDQRPTLIDISVVIIDVDAADIDRLGVDWSGGAQVGGAKVALNTNTGLGQGSFSSLISNSDTFLVRINALEQNARARIVSRPSVVTLDNVQAVLDNNITFYTKLPSDTNPQLASVSTGALMRVTPRLIDEAGKADKVLLTLNIQDGRQLPGVDEADPLPQVQSAEIATQATLLTGQALLLGGFVRDEDRQGERKVPLLGDLPLVGRLFRSTANDGRRVVRLFLIKAEPRPLSVPVSG
ncbi:MAG: EscC/YscC/HrcC family type III secretion system outer membrane ring protein [Paludibacterium sp.]|uniref:EscC/YscC/HrcC family type III secretion system outer membrane ring protein n=1 Tax=Paludibacterium sp. TaxID=1917523 RepID=UPI0025ED1BBE|nr:EscC/YscC/HrcC family type III secretion system outer membrane ring protein [Paludibacterium sp.]MBV8047525.1 EscC/YscC/HrcC family type III secretion system outer membrane ring protein [Paludibacterium sp.]MBV8649594.1 EscC/YscC/HrcC family type III secretion system outer membrane ring protein [Paludibacterium sp.]